MIRADQASKQAKENIKKRARKQALKARADQAKRAELFEKNAQLWLESMRGQIERAIDYAVQDGEHKCTLLLEDKARNVPSLCFGSEAAAYEKFKYPAQLKTLISEVRKHGYKVQVDVKSNEGHAYSEITGWSEDSWWSYYDCLRIEW